MDSNIEKVYDLSWAEKVKHRHQFSFDFNAKYGLANVQDRFDNEKLLDLWLRYQDLNIDEITLVNVENVTNHLMDPSKSVIVENHSWNGRRKTMTLTFKMGRPSLALIYMDFKGKAITGSVGNAVFEVSCH